MIIARSVIFILKILLCVSAYDIKIQDDGPVVLGGTINFIATVFDERGVTSVTTDGLQFSWNDEVGHTRLSPIVKNGTDSWSITYDEKNYSDGAYIVSVKIYKCFWFDYCPIEEGYSQIEFDVTKTLNGNLVLKQRNHLITNNYVSTLDEVIHEVDIKKSDMDFIRTAPSLKTFWFVDCSYYGITTNLTFPFNFTTPDKTHLVEALVMADFVPPTPVTTTSAPITTTTSLTTTTISTTTSSTTTIAPTTKASTEKIIVRRQAANNIRRKSSNILDPPTVSFPFVCNSSYVSTDPTKTYGYFSKEFTTKIPLSKINVTGNNWIQPGDLLSLKVHCDGSKSFEYCIQYKKGDYNVTGNETCMFYQKTDVCDFTIRRYLSNPKSTIVIIIKNDVSKQVTPVTVNIYKVQKQGQLSVIVVPVAFSLVAVVLIVFGVTYYFQNRSRFIIEVADFNFGQQYADMDYKTLRERLRDSIANAFTRMPTPTPSSSEVPVWPPGRKYGSMT